MKIIQKMAALIGTMLLIGCTASNGVGVKQQSNNEFINSTFEEQQQYVATLNANAAALQAKIVAELMAGMPVTFPFDDTDYTVQCIFGGINDRKLVLSIGSDAPSMDRNAVQMAMVIQATQSCETKFVTDNFGNEVPYVILKGQSYSQGLWRAVVERGLPAVVANTGAALINRNSGCDGVCAPTFNVSGGEASSLSQSESNANQHSEQRYHGGSCLPDEGCQ